MARLSSLLIAEQESKRLRSFVRILGGELLTLKQNGVDCENLEYLKGETHYIAACVRKRCLLEGLDDIARTQQYSDKIAGFEKNYYKDRPWLGAAARSS